MISVYSDGSSGSRANKPIGWGWVVVRNETEVLAAGNGGLPTGTNNVAELTGAITGLEALQSLICQGIVAKSEMCELVCDSQYVLGMASGGWSPTKNIELAKRVEVLAKSVNARLRWVKGHQNDTWNCRVDSLAGLAKQIQIESVKNQSKNVVETHSIPEPTQ